MELTPEEHELLLFLFNRRINEILFDLQKRSNYDYVHGTLMLREELGRLRALKDKFRR